MEELEGKIRSNFKAAFDKTLMDEPIEEDKEQEIDPEEELDKAEEIEEKTKKKK